MFEWIKSAVSKVGELLPVKSMIADTYTAVTGFISNKNVRGTIEQGRDSASEVNRGVQNTVSCVEQGSTNANQQMRETAGVVATRSQEINEDLRETIGYGRDAALEVNRSVQDTIEVGKRAALHVNADVQDTISMASDSVSGIAEEVRNTTNAARDDALLVNRDVQGTISLAGAEINAVMRNADSILTTNANTAVNFVGKVCAIYLTITVADYIEQHYYNIETLHVLFSNPSLFTAAAIFIEYKQYNVFLAVMAITTLFILAPAIMFLLWLVYWLLLNTVFAAFVALSMPFNTLFTTIKWFVGISIGGFFGPLLMFTSFWGILLLPSMLKYDAEATN